MVEWRRFLKYTCLGRIGVIPFRLYRALGVPCRQAAKALSWAFESSEYYNYTYDLTAINLDYLASFLAAVSGHPTDTLRDFITELQEDDFLRAELRKRTQCSPNRYCCDVEPRYGRRLGWYALVRATKPRVVFETGVDRGLGTAVLAAAIRRNSAEGCPGMVYASDITPECGHLLGSANGPFHRILIGDSVRSLAAFDQPVDIFLHDSDHRPEYEWAEFQAVEPRLRPTSIVLSDNAKNSPMLRRFADLTERSFLYFQDQPKEHWWPGDGIGAAFVQGKSIQYQQTPASPGGGSGRTRGLDCG